MPSEEFHAATVRQFSNGYVVMFLKQAGRPLTVKELAECGELMIARVNSSQARQESLQKENLLLAARYLVRQKEIVQIGPDRFGLPEQAHKYRTIDDYWDC